MKPSPAFKNTIQGYLEARAQSDELFAKTFQKEGKNIDDCITYILNTVKSSGCNGFKDDEIYSMAVHYYDEDVIEVGLPQSGKVIVNHSITLTDDEIKEIKEKAAEEVRQNALTEAYNKMHRKHDSVKKEEPEKVVQASLFG